MNKLKKLNDIFKFFLRKTILSNLDTIHKQIFNRLEKFNEKLKLGAIKSVKQLCFSKSGHKTDLNWVFGF